MQSVFDWVHDKEMGTNDLQKNITFVDNKHQFCDLWWVYEYLWVDILKFLS